MTELDWEWRTAGQDWLILSARSLGLLVHVRLLPLIASDRWAWTIEDRGACRTLARGSLTAPDVTAVQPLVELELCKYVETVAVATRRRLAKADELPIDEATTIVSRQYKPLVAPAHGLPRLPVDGERQHGISFSPRTVYPEEGPQLVEFLLLRGNLDGALVRVVNNGDNRIILDGVPAFLYAVPEIPRWLHKAGGEIVVLYWPLGQPVTLRLPKLVLLPHYLLSITFDNLAPQPDGLEAVFLMRPMSPGEIDGLR